MSVRRKVYISSSSDENGEIDQFLSDDDEDDVVASSDISDINLDVSNKSNNSDKENKSRESLRNSGLSASGNTASFHTPNKTNRSAASFASSTPYERASMSPLTKFPGDDEVSVILSESLEEISLEGSPVPTRPRGSTGNPDRSRSFVFDDKEDTMSPISKKLSKDGNAAAQQKLRERLLRKTAVAKKNLDISKDRDPRRSRKAEVSGNSSKSNSTEGEPSSSSAMSLGESLTSTKSPMSIKNAIDSSLQKASQPMSNYKTAPSGSHSSTSSLKSLPNNDKSMKFMTPRKTPLIQLDSSSDEEDEDEEEQQEDEDVFENGDEEESEVDGEEIQEVHSGSEKANAEDDVIVVLDSSNELEASGDGMAEPEVIDLGDSNSAQDEEEENEDEEEEEEEGESLSNKIIPIGGSPIGSKSTWDQPDSPQKPKSPPKVQQQAPSGYEGLSLAKLKSERDGFKSTLLSINVNVLPDKGAKIKSKIAALESLIEQKVKDEPKEEIVLLEEREEKIHPMFVPKGPIIYVPPSADNPENINKLLSNDNKRLFGGKMNDNRFEKVQKMTEKALKELHGALNSVPDEQMMMESPSGLKVDLMAHQKQGLAWMMWRESQASPCGILADDMGLGKTLSMISLVLHQKNERLKRKEEENDEVDKQRRAAARQNGLQPSNATLVVAPASLIYQWENEVEKRVKPDRLNVHVFHGNKKQRESDPRRLARYDIVITTFNLLASEMTEKITTKNNEDDVSSDEDERDNWGDQAAVAKTKKKKRIADDSDSVLAKIAWSRIILDEAHAIKNKNTSASKAVCKLHGISKWCLTGTPIHNNLWDLYSLIRFMKVMPFAEEQHWKEFIMISSQKAADRLNLLVKNLLLRRTKTQISTINNKPLLDLKPKVYEQHDLILNGMEAKIYDLMFTATQQKVKQMLSEEENERHCQIFGVHRKKRAEKDKEVPNPFLFGPRKIQGDNFQKFSCMLVMLLRLRQAAVHMHLTKQAVDMTAFDELGGDEQDALDMLEKTMADMTLDSSLQEEDKTVASKIFEKSHLSCKLKKVLDIIDNCMQAKDKIVIVSQWTSFLDILESHLRQRKYNFTSVTGKVTKVSDRQESVNSFNKENGGHSIMLLSLKAGGVGLNLVGGNHLIMVDLHWNPALEAQACDRIYRMGQKKTVYIHRLVSVGTIEQRVLDLQKKKLELAGAVLEGAASKKMNKLTMADLKYLFDLDNKKDD